MCCDKVNTEMKTIYEEQWEAHWNSLSDKRRFFNYFVEWYRGNIIANAVQYYFEMYFPLEGALVECGCGTAQSSSKVLKAKRNLIGLDINLTAIKSAKKNKNILDYVQADIFSLPFKNSSLAGVWNLGVLEHFNEPEIKNILLEFNRVTKPNGVVILWWPPRYGATVLFLSVIEKAYYLITRKQYYFFPNEPSRLKGKVHLANLIEGTGFFVEANYFSLRDLFTYVVVVLRKKQN